MDDDDNDTGEPLAPPPSISRLGRGGPRRYRTLSRFRTRDRFPRQKRLLPIADLIGILIKHHGLTDECRQQFVCIYWEEIVGGDGCRASGDESQPDSGGVNSRGGNPQLAARTWPVRFSEGLLHVETDSSSWVHELQFLKQTLIAKINAWVDANRVWLGPPPLVTDMRFELGGRRTRSPIAERANVRHMKARHRRRLWRPRQNVPPTISDAEREAILRETNSIIDPELRRIVESVRVKWRR